MSTMECDKRNVLLTNICHKCYTNTNGIYHIADKDWSNDMKTAETINIVCTELGITKADLAKRMGMLPPSLYRKLARESMALEELQKCLDVLGVAIEFNLSYPDGKVRNLQANYEMLLLDTWNLAKGMVLRGRNIWRRCKRF